MSQPPGQEVLTQRNIHSLTLPYAPMTQLSTKTAIRRNALPSAHICYYAIIAIIALLTLLERWKIHSRRTFTPGPMTSDGRPIISYRR
jgi:hypothetical protein